MRRVVHGVACTTRVLYRNDAAVAAAARRNVSMTHITWDVTHAADKINAVASSSPPAPPPATSTKPYTSTSAAVTSRVFWTHNVRHVTTSELKREHLQARLIDRQSRFEVRARLRDDGVVSNLYALQLPTPPARTNNNNSSSHNRRSKQSSDTVATHEDAHGSNKSTTATGMLYVYELYATRRVASVPLTTVRSSDAAATSSSTTTRAMSLPTRHADDAVDGGHDKGDDKEEGGSHSKQKGRWKGEWALPCGGGGGGVVATERRVTAERVWRSVRRYLATQLLPMPPLVQLELLLYSPVQLPSTVLRLPRVYWDVDWTVAELRYRDCCTYAELPAAELQRVMNKIVQWVVHVYARQGTMGSGGAQSAAAANGAPLFALVREHTGKLVSLDSGLSAEGLRVFRGTLVQAVFVDDTAALPFDDCRYAAMPHARHNDGGDECVADDDGGNGGDDDPTAGALTSRDLADVALGMTPAQGAPLRFVVVDYLRSFEYKGKPVDSYRIADASGVYYASHWMPHTPGGSLRRGGVYAACAVNVREVVRPTRMRLFEFVDGVTTLTEDTTATAAAATSATRKTTARATATSKRGKHNNNSNSNNTLPGTLALKIDTKGTIASELSLWAEVRQRYGASPYDEATQQRIAAAVEGTPVVVSYSLRQSVVRYVRFGVSHLSSMALPRATGVVVASSPSTTTRAVTALEADTSNSNNNSSSSDDQDEDTLQRANAAAVQRLAQRGVDEELLALLPHMEPGQPYALLKDGMLLPLQVLHCCFDPLMRGWQDTAIAALSHMPERRMQLLEQFRALLATGVRRWGLQLASQPWRSTAVSLLPLPSKTSSYNNNNNSSSNNSSVRSPQPLRHPLPVPFPTTILIVGVHGSTSDASVQQRITQTVQQFAHYYNTTRVTCVEKEEQVVQYMTDQLLVHVPQAADAAAAADAVAVTAATSATAATTLLPTQQIRDANALLIVVTATRESRATRWVVAECLTRGVLPIAVPPARCTRTAALLCGNMRAQIRQKFECNPLCGVDVAREVPALAGRRVLVVGVDTCHTRTVSVGSIVGLLLTPQRNHALPLFWRHRQRGCEVTDVSRHFHGLLAEAVALYDGLDEVVVLQDGDIFSELNAMKADVLARVPRCGLTFMCLHKRCNVRFVHDGASSSGDDDGSSSSSRSHDDEDGGTDAMRSLSRGSARGARWHNVVKGTLIPALTPVHLDCPTVSPSFFLQAHESFMSTARAVQYTVHHVSPTLDVSDVQQLCHVMANVLAPQATKLPMSTRCAHRVADLAERLLHAVPEMRHEYIPQPLRQRLWYL